MPHQQLIQKSGYKAYQYWFLSIFLLFFSVFSQSLLAADEPLEPEKAFRYSARQLSPRQLEVRYRIAPGYYLYKPRFVFKADPDSVRLTPTLPAGKIKQDEFFGQVETYRDEVVITVDVDAPAEISSVTLKVTAQGCADMGLCYPPQSQTQTFSLNDSGVGSGLSLERRTSGLGLSSANSETGLTVSTNSAQATLPVAAPTDESLDESAQVANLLKGRSQGFALLSFFGFGLLLAFTPCMFPLMPILSGIILGQGQHLSRQRAGLLSLTYVLGMASTYAAVGVAAGLTGTLLSSALQSPPVLVVFALIFVGLAGAMFGWYELQMPAVLQSRLSSLANHQQGGAYWGVALMGAISALIAGPCVAAPLAGALLYIAGTGDAWFGGLALFVMALGMGAPLVVLGMFTQRLMPRPGAWMNRIKSVFGMLLLGMALWVASPLYGRWLPVPIAEALGIRTPDSAFKRIADVDDLAVELAEAQRLGKPVMLDFYADWCVSCKEMERDTFPHPAVKAAMQGFVLLKADVTANSDADAALLKRFGLFGPPGTIFFDRQGQEINNLRVVGFMPADKFVKILQKASQ